MKQDFDLHTHTDASDGSLPPSALIEKARSEGVRFICITDHDTVKGIDEAVSAGRKFDVEVVPGVEISVDFSPGTMHLCGYLIDAGNAVLNNKLLYLQQGRARRNEEMIRKLNGLGIDISIEDVKAEAGKEELGRPHLASVMVKKGFACDMEEAFSKYLAKEASCYVDRIRLTLEESLEVIRGSGGIVVLAHPAQLKLAGEKDYRSTFFRLKDMGISGIEAYSSCHSEAENRMFKNLADEADMLVTGGSDFHGDIKPDVELGVFGDVVDIDSDELFKKMKYAATIRRRRR